MIRLYWQGYKSVFPFIISTGLVCTLFAGVLWGFLLYSTVGVFMGYLGFQNFRKDEYFFYHNMGLTKFKLWWNIWLINVIIGVPIFLVWGLLFFLIYGGTRII